MSIKITLKKYILKAFDLKEEELKKTLFLQLNIFLLISTLLIVKPTINSLFLSDLSSDALPVGYVLTAIMAIIGSYFYNKALEKYSLYKIIESTLIGSVFSLVIFGVAFNFGFAKGALLFIPYIWVAIFGLLTASQFWILANLVYNAREAKRVFGFIGAGAIAGGIFGGYLTSLLTSIINAENLLFVAAFFLVGCLLLTRYIWKTEVLKLNTFQVSMRSESKGDSSIRLIKKSKLLSLIAVVIGISVLVAKLVDYQYSDYASRLIEDPEELASFFGFWFSTLSLISLFIQLFLTKKIVGTFGVGKSLLWLPSGILLGSFILLFLPQLWVIVFIKVIDGGLKQSVNKAATELLSIPIPIEIKKKTKTFIDVVIDSIATGIAGFILIFLINALDISSTYISLIIIALILIWLYFIYHLKQAYIVAFKKLLEIQETKKEKAVKKDIPVTSIIKSVIKVFENGTEGQIKHMLQQTLSVKDERFFHPIKNLLSHSSTSVRALALENLYFLKTENLSEAVELMVLDMDQEVTTAAFRYLLKNHQGDPVELFNKYLNYNDITISNAALVGLSLELRNNKKLQDRFSLINKIEQALQSLESLTSEVEKNNKIKAVLEAIGNARVETFYSVLRNYLKSSDPNILNEALLSASNTLDPQFIDKIISHLSTKDSRQTSVNALFNYGEPIIKILSEKIKTETIEVDDAVFSLLVIEKFGNQKAINALTKLTEGTEHLVKIEAIDAIKRLKWKFSHLRINDRFVIDKVLDECQMYQNTLSAIHSQIVVQYKKKSQHPESSKIDEARRGLIHLLEERLDRQLQRIFRLLGIKYPPTDIDPILNSIRFGEEDQRIHAIEFLDNILNNQLKKELIPVAESVLIDNFSEEKIKKLNLKIFSEEECYSALLLRKDAKLKLAVLYLIEQTQDKKFIPILAMASNDLNLKIKARANEILLLLRN